MILFDKKTITDWKERGITNVSISLIQKGCAGQKITVTENTIQDSVCIGEQNGIQIWSPEDLQNFWDQSRVTHAGTKWILTSDQVNTRCGCGSSFSLKSGDPMQDKIKRMKLAMKQKREGVHTN